MRSLWRRTDWWPLVLCWALIGCTRSSPPEILVYHPPAKRVVKETTAPQTVSDVPPPAAVEQPPPPPPLEKKVVATQAAPVAEPLPEPKKEVRKEPTLLGSWRISEMAQKGQVMPMPEGMQMTLTFAEGGTVSMSMSGGPTPEGHVRQGTFSYADGQVTISLDRETKTGKCTFEGSDRVTLEFDEVRMVLTRV